MRKSLQIGQYSDKVMRLGGLLCIGPPEVYVHYRLYTIRPIYKAYAYSPLRRLLYASMAFRTVSVTAAGDVDMRYKSTFRRRRLPTEVT